MGFLIIGCTLKIGEVEVGGLTTLKLNGDAQTLFEIKNGGRDKPNTLLMVQLENEDIQLYEPSNLKLKAHITYNDLLAVQIQSRLPQKRLARSI